MSEKINNIQTQLKTGKGITLLTNEEIEYMQTPIGNALYKNYAERPDKNYIIRPNKNAHWSDVMQCVVCPGTYKRSHKSNHEKTKVHLAYAHMNKKLVKLLIQDK